METVTSKDGTKIVYDQLGQGPLVIMVSGAFSYRKFPLSVKLAELLAAHFTVINYDRRGRGDSGDTQPYSIEREVEDIEALIDANGGSAYIWGLSSGAILSLKASAKLGKKVKKLAVHEPPFFVDDSRPALPVGYVDHINQLIAADKRGEAVTYFMTAGMGAPAFIIPILRLMPGAWKRLTAVANTIPYDVALTEPYQTGGPLPADQWTGLTMPTIVMVGSESPAWMIRASEALAALLPHARLINKKGLGHTKSLYPNVIAPVLIEFFADNTK